MHSFDNRHQVFVCDLSVVGLTLFFPLMKLALEEFRGLVSGSVGRQYLFHDGHSLSILNCCVRLQKVFLSRIFLKP